MEGTPSTPAARSHLDKKAASIGCISAVDSPRDTKSSMTPNAQASSHHRRTDTISSTLTLSSVGSADMSTDLTFRSPMSDIRRIASSDPETLKRLQSVQRLSSLENIGSPRTFQMHSKALRYLSDTISSITAFLNDPERRHWDAATVSYNRAVSIAAHISIWAGKVWPSATITVVSEFAMVSGQSILPRWNAYEVLFSSEGWGTQARQRRRLTLAEEALRRSRIFAAKQEELMETLQTNLEHIVMAANEEAKGLERILSASPSF